MQLGLAPEQVNEFVNKLQMQRYQQLQQQQGEQIQRSQGLGEVQRQAAEPTRQQQIEQQPLGTM